MATTGEMAQQIEQYIEDNGRLWKSKLRDEFLNGINKCPILQQFRNQHIDMLDKIKQFDSISQIIEKINKDK